MCFHCHGQLITGTHTFQSPKMASINTRIKIRMISSLFRKGGFNPTVSSLTSTYSSSHKPNPRICDDSDNNNNRNDSFRNISVMSALGCISAATLLYAKSHWKRNDTLASLFLPETAHCSETESRSKRFNFIAEAVEMAAPAVVSIQCTEVIGTIFGHMTVQPSGSGFIINEEGHVLTNAHVVRNSRKVKVTMSNGKTLNGAVSFVDPNTDLALIKLKLGRGEKLPYLPFGNSKDLRSGEWVIALGSPLALSNTITAGIVSCVHRPSSEMGLAEKPDMEYIQTDAMITKGNSGGPLVNLDGQVIGVNTMTAGPGISFAIPSNFVKEFIEATKKAKKKPNENKYGLGVSLLTITPDLAYRLHARGGLPRDVTQGVLLVEVWSDGAADDAGLMRGDVIVGINGKHLRTSKEVQRLVQLGQIMEFQVIRNGTSRTIVVTPSLLN